MILHQCDRCGKDISTANDIVKVGYHSYGFFSTELCADCGKLVVQFLKRIEKQLKSRKTHPTTA